MSKAAASPSPDALLEARLKCLEAALQLRTPGTSAEVAVGIAEVFWQWVKPEPAAEAPEKKADNRTTPAR